MQWVRNCEDGSVEILAQGEEEALKKFEEWCSHGPPPARVTKVEREEKRLEDCKEFIIRH